MQGQELSHQVLGQAWLLDVFAKDMIQSQSIDQGLRATLHSISTAPLAGMANGIYLAKDWIEAQSRVSSRNVVAR